ncbi:uncharacterized protein B0H18DRAFT_955913 [Fomitopsis serialis]|uniref:uncharacterized protein n=1 Tax=Fomitopsis serialis TaxID=139415 RepID=UPI0020073713|nr:uncharacterized protein B0H18DRAFT_955913 [Neoantrodia serialis]KAH9923375.1 hypothetical protein B0H18DRAFT_955913 [Neoantrodia serialis]
MVKHKHTIEELLNDTCGTCQKGFKTTQGLGAHQTMSKKCSWTVRTLSRPDNKDWPQQDPHEEDADANHNVGEDNELDSLFDFIDFCVPSKHPIDPGGQGNDGGSGSGSGDRDSGNAGPSTTSIPNSRRTALSLDDNDDEQVVDEDEEAGVITDVDSHMHNKWLEGREEAPSAEEEGAEDQSKNAWEPFESEMDWQFASWAIQEGLTLGSIDKALEIPGVSDCSYYTLEQ